MAGVGDIIGAVIGVAFEIYNIIEEVKTNKKRCRRLKERINSLIEPVSQARKLDDADMTVYREALTQLLSCLQSSKAFIVEFKNLNRFLKVWERDEIKSRFNDINLRLDSLVPALCLGLQVATTKKIDEMFEQTRKIKEDLEDERTDWETFEKLITEMRDDHKKIEEELHTGFENVNEKIETVVQVVARVEKIVKEMDYNKSAIERGSILANPTVDLRVIESCDLNILDKIGEGTYGTVYKAEFKRTGDTVAVKKYLPNRIGSNAKLLKHLQTEARKMKTFDSMNVIRLFGICAEKDNYLLVMEYMSETSLRHVLDNHKKYKLDWKIRLRMAREGACGLFRIHNAGMLHRNIGSEKFLVNADLHVKISDCGFALTKQSAAKRESSIRKSQITYIAPEHLIDLNTEYKARSEVYGYGIVMWEIATLRKPYEGLSDSEIWDRLVNDKRMEPLTNDCLSLAQLLTGADHSTV